MMTRLICTAALLLSLCANGCTPATRTVKPTTSVGQGWHPDTRKEMEGLIGNTVLQAIHQYNQRMLQLQERSERPSSKLRLEPKPL